MTPEELKVLKNLHDQVAAVETALLHFRESQLATARAVRNLADGLTQSESRQQRDDRALYQLQAAHIAVVASLERLTELRDARTMSPDDMADLLGTEGFEKICLVRQILWARKHAHRGLALPLPPAPHDLVPIGDERVATAAPVVEHRRANDTAPHKHRRKDDSLTVNTHTDKDGRTVVRTRLNFDFRWPTKREWIQSVIPWLGSLGWAIYYACTHAP